MQNPYPPSRVLISREIPKVFEIAPTDTYIDIFTGYERKKILEKYQTPNLFNGSCVRLDSLVNSKAVLSPVTFYDFLCCNIVGIHNKDELAYPKLKQYLDNYGKIDTFDKVLQINVLPNIIGTSTLLHDTNNEYLLVERNTKVSIGSGLFACSSSGSLEVDDLSSPNPIIGCGQRELKEELNLNMNLYIEGIVIPVQKMQPIALLTGMVDRPWRELIPYMKTGIDFQKENNRVLVVPKDKLLAMISMYAFTDAASFHIFFEAGGDLQKWKQAENTILRISDYYI